MRSFLEVLAHRPRLSDDDWLEVTYYLLLQDRVEEALAAFARGWALLSPEGRGRYEVDYRVWEAMCHEHLGDHERALDLSQWIRWSGARGAVRGFVAEAAALIE